MSVNSFDIEQLWLAMDDPIELSLRSTHHHLAICKGNTMKYPDDISPMAAISAHATTQDWNDLGSITAPGTTIIVEHPPQTYSHHMWFCGNAIPCVSLLGDRVTAKTHPEIVPLHYADLPKVIELYSRARPGVFCNRTFEMGTFYGIFSEGRLIAAGGQRLHPDPFIEISGVSTDPDYQQQGLASKIITHIIAKIHEKNRIPYINAISANTKAIRLYSALGFRAQKEVGLYPIRKIS